MRLLLLALAIACLSQPANLIRWAAAPIEAIGFWRMLIAALALSPAAWSARGAWRGVSVCDRRLTVMAGLLFFTHLWTFVYAAQHTTIANTMIAFSTHPLWTGAGAWFLFGERFGARLGAAYLLAAAGVWILVSGSLAFDPQRLPGDLAALLSAALFSGYALCGRRLRRVLPNAPFAAAVFWVVAACFFLTGELRGVAWTGYAWQSWAAFFALAVVVTLGGHALFTYLLGTMSVTVLSFAKLLEPIGAALGAWAAFGEPVTRRTVIAMGFIAGGVLVLVLGKRTEGYGLTTDPLDKGDGNGTKV